MKLIFAQYSITIGTSITLALSHCGIMMISIRVIESTKQEELKLNVEAHKVTSSPYPEVMNEVVYRHR